VEGIDGLTIFGQKIAIFCPNVVSMVNFFHNKYMPEGPLFAGLNHEIHSIPCLDMAESGPSIYLNIL